MNQNDIDRAVAAATGETVSAIKRLGFLIADPDEPILDPTDPVHGGRVIDWDDYHLFEQDFNDRSFIHEAAIG